MTLSCSIAGGGAAFAAAPPRMPSWLPKPGADAVASAPQADVVALSTRAGGPGLAGRATTRSAWQANAVLACTRGTWNPIQARANGLVLGNCKNAFGWYLGATSFAIAQRWNGDPTPRYWGGYIGGSYAYCGWINDYRLTRQRNLNPYPGVCKRPDLPKVAYVSCSGPPCSDQSDGNRNLAIITDPNSSNDGLPVTNERPCPEYANYRPWASGQQPRDFTGVIEPPHPRGTLAHPGRPDPYFKLRYVARYPARGTNEYYAMVHAGSAWVFVPWSCITG